jgi:trigger factor
VSVVVSDQEIAPSVRELKIEVPAAAVAAETHRVVEEYRRKVRLPGFRKGKAPLAVVRGRYREDIDQEVLERLVPRYWHQAEAEKSLQPLLAPRIQKVEIKDGEPLVFDAIVEVRPEIQLSPNRHFDLPDPATAVTEEEVDEVIVGIRRNAAPWVAAPRAAARGDRVELRLRDVGKRSTTADAEEVVGDEAQPSESPELGSGDGGEGAEWQEAAFEVGDERVWEELSLAVTGLAVGQRGSFSRKEQVHHNHDHDHADGEPCDHQHEVERSYEFEVSGVLERDVPELTDEVARGIGDFATVDELRKTLAERLGNEKVQRRRREREQLMLGQLVERHPFQVPERVVQNEMQQILREYAESMAHSGVDPAKADVDWENLAERFVPMADRRVRARLVLDALAEADNVPVAEAELEAVIRLMAQRESKSPLQLRNWLDSQGQLGPLKQDLRRQRTIRRLLGEDDGGPATLEVVPDQDTDQDPAEAADSER